MNTTKVFLICTLFLSTLGLAIAQPVVDSGAAKAAPTPLANILFPETSFDFGDIQQGDKVSHIFQFTNTGAATLVVSDVQTTCGCTASQWSKEPIPVGKSGQINVSFNSAGKVGKQNKVITIYSNAASKETRVSIVANILTPQPAPSTPEK